ncbi:unnamed protein product [Scytosiphon promiscuus]
MKYFAVKVQDPRGIVTKDLLVYPGIPWSEIQQALKAAFSIPHQVAGLVNPLLDIYFPIALFGRAPKYFSQSTPFRIVPLHGDGGKQARGKKRTAALGLSPTGLEHLLKRVLQTSFSMCVSTQQAAPDKRQRTPVNPSTPHGLVELRRELRLYALPAEELLGELETTAASDGKLTRAEFDMLLKRMAKTMGIPALPTGNEIFDLFDDAREGVLHVRQLAAGLIVLCDGSMRCACRLYVGPGGTMGVDDISEFILSILKVLCVASPVDLCPSGVWPRKLCGVLSSDVLARKGLPRSARINLDNWSSSSLQEAAERGGDRAQMPEPFREHDLEIVLELLSEFADRHGGISLPAFVGCMRALLEVDGRSILTDAEITKLKVSLKQLFDNVLDDNRVGPVPFKDLATDVSTFCGKQDDAKIRAALKIYGGEGGHIAEHDMQIFLEMVFKVMFELDPDAVFFAENCKGEQHTSPTRLAETAASAFDDAALGSNGPKGIPFENFLRWYRRCSSVKAPSAARPEAIKEEGEHKIDVEEVHRIFRLGDIKATRFVEGLNATANNGRVSWISFLRYMFNLADARPLTQKSRAAIAMARRLFDAYDTENQQEVDLGALASGLKLLFCRMDPYIRTATMATAHTEEVMVEESKIPAPESADDGLSPMMEQTGRDHAAVETADEERAESPISGTLDQARRDTGLCNTPAACSFEVLQNSLNERGRLTRPAVHGCVRRLRSTAHNGREKSDRGVIGENNYTTAAGNVVNRLFDAIDVRNVGDVDFREMASALSVLCGGTREEKMLAVFNLFHPGPGGKITVQDIATYITSAFRVMFKLQPSLEAEVGDTPEALGSVTASDMLQEVSPNGDGRISPRDFGWWLFRGVSAEGFAHDPARLDSPGSERTGDGDARPHGQDAQNGRSGGQTKTLGLWGDMVARARQLLCLDRFDMEGLMDMLGEVATAGTLALDDFWRCIGYVLQLGGTAEGTVEWDEAFLLTERIHRALQDDDGVVAFAAITCGTSILCQISLEDKIQVAFVLFDTDGDEMLAFEEVTMYIASMLRVVCAVGHDVSAVMDPDELGSALASRCFEQARVPLDEKLGMDGEQNSDCY